MHYDPIICVLNDWQQWHVHLNLFLIHTCFMLLQPCVFSCAWSIFKFSPVLSHLTLCTYSPPGARIWFKQAPGQPIRRGSLHTQSCVGHPEPKIPAVPEQWTENQWIKWQRCGRSGRQWVTRGEQPQAVQMGDHPGGSEQLPRLPRVSDIPGLGRKFWQGGWGLPQLCLYMCEIKMWGVLKMVFMIIRSCFHVKSQNTATDIK